MASEIDSINLQNGGVSLDIPLASLPPVAGGKLSYTLSAHYNSKLLVKYSTETEGTTGPPMQCPGTYSKAEYFLTNPQGGWRIGGGYSIDFRPATEDYAYLSNPCHPTYPGYFFKPLLITPDGSEHEMRIYGSYDMGGPTDSITNYYKADAVSSIITSPTRFYTIDGTYLTAIVNPSGYSTAFTIYTKDGTKIEQIGAVQKMTDTNGNSIELGFDTSGNYNYAKDTYTDRIIKWSSATYESQDATKVEYRSPGGDWQTVWVVWGSTQIKGKVFWRQGWNMNTDMPCLVQDTLIVSAMPVVRQVIFPQTESYAPPEYAFEYNSDTVYSSTISNYLESCTMSSYSYTRDVSKGLGEVSKVTTPSGAEINYKYVSDDQHSFADEYYGGSANYYLMKNSVVEKSVEHDGTTDTWTYGIYNGGTVTNPDGSTYTEEYYPFDPYYLWLHGVNGLGGLQVKAIRQGRVLTEKHWTLLGGDLTAMGTSSQRVAFNPVVDTEYTTLLDEDGNRVKMTAKTFDYDYNGDLKTTTEYDWINLANVTYTNNNNSVTGIPTGIPSGTAVLRVTNNTYYNTASTSSDSTAYHKRSLSSPLDILGKVKESTVGTSSTVKSDTKFSYDGQSWGTAPSLGNLTKVSAYNDVTSSWIDTVTTYTSKGNVATVTDPNGCVTQMTYGAINSYTDLYPTQTVQCTGTSVARTSSATYDFYTGLPTSVTDNDNSITNTTEYDSLGRPIKVISADTTALESWTVTEYHDHDRYVVVRSDLDALNDQKRVAIQHFDQLGRVRLARTLEDAATEDPAAEADGIKAKTLYKASALCPWDDNSPPAEVCSFQVVSNPYRSSSASEPTMGWTRTATQNNGRRSEVETFSGDPLPKPFLTSGYNTNSTGIVKTTIENEATIVEDQAGKVRRSITNSLGWLIRVDEPNSSNQLGTVSSPNQATSYAYDVLNNLTTVSQGSQTRTFSYSSLSRLTSATNPESGTIDYSYDPNGNLTRKTDARGVQTDYVYDELNRIASRSYSTPGGAPANYQATPNVTYTYGTTAPKVGILTKVESSVSTTEYTAFDILGRVTASKQTTDGVEYESGYEYNLAGALIEETYPSGRIVRDVLDNSGDLSIVQSKKTANSGYWNYASSFTYNAAGAVTSMQLGNGRWESTAFNSRLQPTAIYLGSVEGGHDKLKLNYSYGNWNGTSIDETKNNGNLVQQVITVPGVGTEPGFTATQKYYYDSLNRIDDASEDTLPDGGSSTQSWRQDFAYDRYGNRNFVEANTSFAGFDKLCNSNTELCADLRKKLNPAINTSDNRLSSGQGYSFDDSGNTTRDASDRKFTYDAENKQVKVESLTPGTNTVTGTIGEYSYDGDGRRVKKVVPKPDPEPDEVTVFVYDAAGKLIAEYSTVIETTNAKVAYLTNDHLGSPRINTDANGAVTSRHDYHPFGEEIATSQRTSGLGYIDDTVRKQFTGYERDRETALDFARARYFVSTAGRFSTPDPLLSSGRTGNPQTWNRFAYVLGNPLSLTDPFGLFEWSEELGGSTTSEQFEQELETLRGSRKGKSKNDKKEINAKIDRIKQILSRRNSVLSGLTIARAAANNLSGNQQARVKAAIDSYGGEHEKNGVIIAVGDSAQTGQGLAGIEDGSVVVAIRPNEFSADTLFMTLAHEGSHVLDAQREILLNSPPMSKNFPVSGDGLRSNITARETEYSAYSVSFWAAKGNNYSKSVGIGGNIFYQPGWREVDAQRLDQALGQIGRGPNDQAGRISANWDIRGQWR